MIPRRYLLVCATHPDAPLERVDGWAQASALTIVYRTDQIVVLAEDDQACIPLETGDGVFIGTVFDADQPSGRVSTIARGMSHAILASGGKEALKAYWGGYILACSDRHRRSLSVSRDPSGAMPCYMAKTKSVLACASDPDTLMATGFVQPSIAYPTLIRHLLYPDVSQADTCLDGVHELLPGIRLEQIDGSCTTQSWWSPWSFTADPMTGDTESLAAQLRATIDRCVLAWSGCCHTALISLSGGLDSSIVASALVQGKASATGLNMVDDGAEGDERAYARCVSAYLGIDLVEAPYDPAMVDLRTTSAPNRARPVGTAHMQPFEQAVRLQAATSDADALFNGMAGDSVFCSLRSALPVVDSLRARRSAVATWRTLQDVAKRADVSALAVARQTARMLVRGRRPLCPSGMSRFLTPAALDSLRKWDPPPWLCPPPGTALGRAYHVEMIARLQAFVEGFDRWSMPATVVPLLSQPVLELCLRIPSWHWVSDGKDRAVARMAYRDRLPIAIVDRHSKGGPNAMSRAVCLDNLSLLRELVLDGALMRRGVLNRPIVEQALTRQALTHFGHHLDALSLVETESWIARWSSARSRHPADAS